MIYVCCYIGERRNLAIWFWNIHAEADKEIKKIKIKKSGEEEKKEGKREDKAKDLV